jgi:outer membrane protein assembly factor BamB
MPVFRSLICFLMVPCFCCAGDFPAWPRWRGPGADGRWNPESLPKDLAESQPKELWRAKIGGGFGGVTVADGRVYLMDYEKSPEQERVLCFDLDSGEKLWATSWGVTYGKMDYGTGPRASVVVDRFDGSLFAYTLGATGIATCLDAVSGKVIWQIDTQKTHGSKVPTWGFSASPLIRKETVILHVGATPGGALLALDRKSGAEVWRAGDDPAGYCTPEWIEHAGQEQLIAWGPEHIQSFDPDTGKAFWKYPYKITYGVSIAQPHYADGVLFVSGYWHGTKAFRLGKNPSEVSLLWEQEKEICGLMSAGLSKKGRAYLLDKNKGLTCFEIESGNIHWSDDNKLSPGGRNPQFSLVWLDESRDLVALLNSDGELVYARLGEKGAEEIARHQIIGKTWAHPAFVGSQVIARSDTDLVAWKLW